MGLKTVSDAWRAFSLDKEATFGVPVAVGTSLNFSGEPIEASPDKVWTDKDELNGELAPTRQQVLTSKLEGKHGQNASPHNVALFLSWLTGKVTTTTVTDAQQPTVKLHKIGTLKEDVLLPTRTVREHVGGVLSEYTGVACSDLSLSVSREDFLKLDATLVGSGKETVITPVTARPAQVAESYLLFGDCRVLTGGTFDGTSVTGGTEISTRVRDVKMSFKNGAKFHHLFGDNTTYAGRGVRGRTLDIGLDLSLEYEDQTERSKLLASETFTLEIPVVGSLIGSSSTNHYEVRFVFPRCAYSKTKRGADDGLLTLAAGINVFADPTHGPFVCLVKNEQAKYL